MIGGIVTVFLCDSAVGVEGTGKQQQYLIDQVIIQSKQREDKDLGQCYCRVKISNLEPGMSDCVARLGERKQKLG